MINYCVICVWQCCDKCYTSRGRVVWRDLRMQEIDVRAKHISVGDV